MNDPVAEPRDGCASAPSDAAPMEVVVQLTSDDHAAFGELFALGTTVGLVLPLGAVIRGDAGAFVAALAKRTGRVVEREG